MGKKRIIVSNIYDIEDYRDSFNEWCEINDYDEDEMRIYDFAEEECSRWFEDEQMNLKHTECGDILCIADLGLWNGRRSGYQIIKADNLADIFRVGMRGIDNYEFYQDRYDVKATLMHHDGTNYVTFREIKSGVNVKPLLDKIYNQEEFDQKLITKYTKSLKPKVSKVYGW